MHDGRSWPADKVERRDIKTLIPYARNSRTHSDDQITQIAASIKEWGFTNPILVDADNEIIAGHGRLLAAKKLNLQEVPCILADGWSEAQKKAYVIADNKLALNAGWDTDMLSIEFSELKDLEFNLSLTGFDADELAKLLQEPDNEGLTDEDDVPEPPQKPKTVEGDIWVLGNHRLMCGDSTDIDAVENLMDGSKADMVFTDPPYNADYKSRGSNELLRQGIKNDAMSDDKFEDFIKGFLSTIYANVKSGAAYYICCNWKDSYPRFYLNLSTSGINVSSCIVWNKGSGGMGWQDYRYQYEFIIYGFKEGSAHSWYGGRTETDIWEQKREARQKYVHPTQKPVELIERALNNSSKADDVILDLFGGSGSTLVACEKIHRYARLMELDPQYCDVIIKRWQDYTGQEAINEQTGKTYAESN
jgi:DNA modification methylase